MKKFLLLEFSMFGKYYKWGLNCLKFIKKKVIVVELMCIVWILNNKIILYNKFILLP